MLASCRRPLAALPPYRRPLAALPPCRLAAPACRLAAARLPALNARARDSERDSTAQAETRAGVAIPYFTAVRLQDKAVKRYVVRNIVDAASLRDIMEACTIDGEYLHGEFRCDVHRACALTLRLRRVCAPQALPQDVLLHLGGDPLPLRARAVARGPARARAAEAVCASPGG
jgi:ribosomal protein S26